MRDAFFGRLGGGRALYLVFAVLALAPVAAFAIGPLSGESFDLGGPGGPLLAFSAGVLSFVSPCVLPLVPIYMTHLSGASVVGGKIVADRRLTFTHALAFVGGLSLVFILLGASVGLLGSYVIKDRQREFEQVAGVVLVVMGVVLMPARGGRSPMRSALLLLGLTLVFLFLVELASLQGDRPRLAFLAGVLGFAWLKFSGYITLPFLSRTFDVDLARNRQMGYTRSALVGGAFALGWTPCIGPILSSILALGLSQGDALQAVYLLVAYSAGLSIPFLIAGLALADTTRFLKRIQPYAPFIEVASGVMLIGVGVLLMTGRLSGLNQYFQFADFNRGL